MRLEIPAPDILLRQEGFRDNLSMWESGKIDRRNHKQSWGDFIQIVTYTLIIADICVRRLRIYV